MPRQASRIVRRPKTRGRKPPTLSGLKKKAWALLSECVRREASNETYKVRPMWNGEIVCYTCPTMSGWKEMQAGHAIGGRNGAVLLDEEIIRPQCVRCNIMLRGNYGEFITRLVRERAAHLPRNPGNLTYTEVLAEAMDWWDGKLSTSRQIRKWSRSELEEKILGYRERLAKL